MRLYAPACTQSQAHEHLVIVLSLLSPGHMGTHIGPLGTVTYVTLDAAGLGISHCGVHFPHL